MAINSPKHRLQPAGDAVTDGVTGDGLSASVGSPRGIGLAFRAQPAYARLQQASRAVDHLCVGMSDKA
jgi:hypothetical protein